MNRIARLNFHFCRWRSTEARNSDRVYRLNSMKLVRHIKKRARIRSTPNRNGSRMK
jgi:hypothetical protein